MSVGRGEGNCESRDLSSGGHSCLGTKNGAGPVVTVRSAWREGLGGLWQLLLTLLSSPLVYFTR